MKARYNSKSVHIFEEGDTVSVRVPRIDRAATDLHRLACVVIERLGRKRFLYRLQCEHGVLDTCYPGGDLEVHTGSVNATADWKSAVRISLREAAKKSSPFNCYYGTFCNCKGHCSGKKCSCQKAHKPCSTRCHSGRSCLNDRDGTRPPTTAEPSRTRPPTTAEPSCTQIQPPTTAEPSRTRPPTTAEPSRTRPPTTAEPSRTRPPTTAEPSRTRPPTTAEPSHTQIQPPTTAEPSHTQIQPPTTAEPSHTQPTRWWVKQLSLREQDRHALTTGDWLNDLHISAAQKLLKAAFPNIGSLQSPVLGERLQFKPAATAFVQILNFCGHWACVSTIGCKPGHVNVYDSLFSTPPASLVRQLCCLIQTKEAQLTVNMMEMQSQVGTSDCGCFAIACAAALCHGLNPSSLTWAQTKMRDHLDKCLTDGQLTLFPGKKKTNKSRAPDVKKTCTFPVFCSCRAPADRKGMLQCRECSEWFHRKCANISSSLFKKNVVWTCPSCCN